MYVYVMLLIFFIKVIVTIVLQFWLWFVATDLV